MHSSELLLLLFIGHFVGDFVLQTRSMALNKKTSFRHLLAHVFVYTTAVTLFALPSGQLSTAQISIIFLGHAYIDKSSFIKWWVKTINGSPEMEWLTRVVDQSWHFILLYLVVYVVA